MKALVVAPYYLPKLGGLEMYAHQLNIPLNQLWPLMIRRIIKREQPDIIIAHTPVPSMADAARLAAGKTPLVVVYHAATLLKGESFVFDTIARLYQWYERSLLQRANVICAVSDFVKAQFPARLQTKTVVLPNAVWERQIATRQQPQSRQLLFIGSLDRTHAWKGLNLIIDAVADARQRYGDELTLSVMGDGNNRQAYRQQAAALGIEKAVTFLGNLIGEPKEQALRSAMALVAYPTSANDAFPTVMLEAWARSVPVVGSAIGFLPSLIDDGRNGYLVPPCDVRALAGKLHE